jgi:glycerophosphoryl diester phosphodiesterase
MRKFQCIGHRGARGEKPENTLLSVRRALELGADGIEVDVYFVDGHLMVIHDHTLNRTTNGTGRIARRSFDYLRSLDAGKGEKIPTLDEVCDTVNRRAFINIELKGPHTAGPVAALIEHRVKHLCWQYGDFLVSSFRHGELRKLAGSKIPIGILFSRSPRRFAKLASGLGADSVHTNLAYATPRFVEQAHGHGLKVFVYTVNHAADVARMKTMGVDGVFTDFPSRFE